MTLTPRQIRQDLKCGRGAISEGEICHVGPASKVQVPQRASIHRKSGLSTGEKLAVSAIVGYAGLTAAAVVALQNQRQAMQEKFDNPDKYKTFEGPEDDIQGILSKMQHSSRMPSDSIFGEVRFGRVNNENVVVKRVKSGTSSELLNQLRAADVISDQIATGMSRNAQNGTLSQFEVDLARKAGEIGIGPKVIAANKNTLIMNVADGRPLQSVDKPFRFLRRNVANQAPDKLIPKALFVKLTRGSELNSEQKRALIAGLGRMHSAGIAHNDLHPNNVFISSKGVQFIDYGLADKGGAAVASEFVRLMNKPRFGLNQAAGLGYNLRTEAPKEYATTEARIKKLIGKRTGVLTSADIRKAIKTAGSDSSKLESDLQQAIDDFYLSLITKTRRDSLTPQTIRADLKCSNGSIPEGETCHVGKATNAAYKEIKRRRGDVDSIYADGFDSDWASILV